MGAPRRVPRQTAPRPEKRVVAFAVGLVVATFLLGGGWLAASLRERRASLDAEEARLHRSARAVASVVDESLDELRVREDHRPFYVYNHFYAPPDVLAIADPIAVSPLAGTPDDPRLIGHFQLDPTGRVTTPYDDPEQPASERTQTLRAIVDQPAFDPLRALATVDESVEETDPRPTPTVAATDTYNDSPLLNLRLSGENPATPSQSLTTALDNWGSIQAQDIRAAQRGDQNANSRVIERGQQMPRISRRNVAWEDVEDRSRQQQQSVGTSSSSNRSRTPIGTRTATAERAATRGRTPTRVEVARAMQEAEDDVRRCGGSEDIRVDAALGGRDGRLRRVRVSTEDEALRECVSEAVRARTRLEPFTANELTVAYVYRAAAPEPTSAAEQPEAEVDYTDMVFGQHGDRLLMTRVVTHGGISIVQGVMLDAAFVENEWIPALAARHAATETPPRVVRPGEGACRVREPASRYIALELCYPSAASDAAVRDLDAQLRWQLGGLLALLLMATLAAAAIVRAARKAEALSRQKSAFVSAVSHELRTPLTTIRMHAEMLDEGLVKEERRQKVHRELVRESVRLARLVDNVLSLSLLEEGRRTVHPSEGDLRAHVREVVEGQRAFVEERGFALNGPTDDAEPLTASFDPQALDQIVVNLIDNAVKYAAGEDKRIDVEVARREGRVHLTVSDRGPGIPSSDRGRVFERFHRVEREDTAHAPGTGIGLALVADLARAHGGEATVEARPGGGCTVRIVL